MIPAVIYFFGAAAVLSTLLMVFQRSPVKSALLMLAALLSTAGIYLALSAQMLSALQIILYGGAIMVLFIVAMTVMPYAWRDHPARRPFRKVLGLAASAVILIELLKVSAALKTVFRPVVFSETGALALARELFGRFVFQFELLSLVILTAIVAATALAMHRRQA